MRGYLYVGKVSSKNPCCSVLVYAPNSTKVAQTITNGIDNPTALAFDSSGNLYVANIPYHKRGWVSVYPPGGKSPVTTITKGINNPSALAIDATGTLYVSNCPRCFNVSGSVSVSVYTAGKQLPSYSISKGVSDPYALALDSSGDLYVANSPLLMNPARAGRGSISVYPPGKATLKYSVTEGVDGPSAMAFDSSGNLYVAEYDGGGYCKNIGHLGVHGCGAVTVYAQHSRALKYEIPLRGAGAGPDYPVDPLALAFDRSGNLYVGGSYVLVFAPGAVQPLAQLYTPTLGCSGLAFDRAGTAYAFNSHIVSQTVTYVDIYEYEPERVTPRYTVETGLNFATSMAISP